MAKQNKIVNVLIADDHGEGVVVEREDRLFLTGGQVPEVFGDEAMEEGEDGFERDVFAEEDGAHFVVAREDFAGVVQEEGAVVDVEVLRLLCLLVGEATGEEGPGEERGAGQGCESFLEDVTALPAHAGVGGAQPAVELPPEAGIRPVR